MDVEVLKGDTPRKVMSDHDGVSLADYGEYQYSSHGGEPRSHTRGRRQGFEWGRESLDALPGVLHNVRVMAKR
ncbi:hypothetical protein [Streptomyces sp. NPDC004296]|uniref:hypothetical protein n=1 Tax=Streptomyces sp. NPDC004296 TaxID=3364697 RepID=UPI0036B60F69